MTNKATLYNTFNRTKFYKNNKKTSYKCLEWQKIARNYNDVNENAV